MDKTEEARQGTPQATGQPSAGGTGSTPTGTPRTYTEIEAQKMVSDALAVKGREHKTALDAITKERDTFKTQVEGINTELASLKESSGELEQAIEQLSGNDPEKKKLVALLKENSETARTLKAAKLELEADKLTHAEEIKMAKDTILETDAWDIASEYEGGDATKLKALAIKAKTTSKEDIAEIAATIWTKKASAEKTSMLSGAPDSGATSGDGIDYDKLKPGEKIEYGLKHPPKK